jgi:hypothetical protein
VCVLGGGGGGGGGRPPRGDRVVWRAYTGVIYCVFGQIRNLHNCFTALNKNLGGNDR